MRKLTIAVLLACTTFGAGWAQGTTSTPAQIEEDKRWQNLNEWIIGVDTFLRNMDSKMKVMEEQAATSGEIHEALIELIATNDKREEALIQQLALYIEELQERIRRLEDPFREWPTQNEEGGEL